MDDNTFKLKKLFCLICDSEPPHGGVESILHFDLKPNLSIKPETATGLSAVKDEDGASLLQHETRGVQDERGGSLRLPRFNNRKLDIVKRTMSSARRMEVELFPTSGFFLTAAGPLLMAAGMNARSSTAVIDDIFITLFSLLLFFLFL